MQPELLNELRPLYGDTMWGLELLDCGLFDSEQLWD